jgi:hypothetical protein
MSPGSGVLRLRPLSRVLIIIAVALAALIWQYRIQLQAFPDIISAYTAKEYCSCRYVMNNPAEYCRAYVKQWLPSDVQDDESNRTVSANGLGRTHSAAWIGARQGCRLLPPKP